MKVCLDSAISVDDKTACEDKRDEQLKACSDGECKIEREKREQKNDFPPPASNKQMNFLHSAVDSFLARP